MTRIPAPFPRRPTVRQTTVERTRLHLERSSFPRLQMFLLVAVTGAIGLLSSFLMLHAGMTSMALRYPLALAVAYLGFLTLLWVWLRSADGDVPVPVDLAGGSGSGCQTDAPGDFSSAGGGDYAGGGASASFEGPQTDGGGALSSMGDAAGSVDELAVPLVAVVMAIAVACGLALTCAYMIYIAPSLLAELLVDGVLAASLYKYLRRSDSRHWLVTAVRRTTVPFLVTALFLAASGAAMNWAAPEARSIGDVIQQFKHRRAG